MNDGQQVKVLDMGGNRNSGYDYGFGSSLANSIILADARADIRDVESDVKDAIHNQSLVHGRDFAELGKGNVRAEFESRLASERTTRELSKEISDLKNFFSEKFAGERISSLEAEKSDTFNANLLKLVESMCKPAVACTPTSTK